MEQVINYDYLIKCRASTNDYQKFRDVLINTKHIVAIEVDDETDMLKVITSKETYMVPCDLENFTLPLQGQYIVREVNK